jgi:uncharacterized protein YecE (DUF72 family)
MNVRIGTAGYSYDSWIGEFYPRRAKSNEMLPFYASQFPIVEINSSFYRPPTTTQVVKMADRTSAEFMFTFKVPRSASHEQSTKDLPAFRHAVDHLAERGKLSELLLQLPQSFHNTAASREWVVRIAEELCPHRIAVEFRHRSWAAANLTDWLEHVGLDVVSVSVPDIESLFPSGLRIANRRIYVRFHSENAANWYAGGAHRYNYDYPESSLCRWSADLAAAAKKQVEECSIFFNNCVTTQAVANARRLAELLKAISPEVTVIDPPRRPAQPSLFGDGNST